MSKIPIQWGVLLFGTAGSVFSFNVKNILLKMFINFQKKKKKYNKKYYLYTLQVPENFVLGVLKFYNK